MKGIGEKKKNRRRRGVKSETGVPLLFLPHPYGLRALLLHIPHLVVYYLFICSLFVIYAPSKIEEKTSSINSCCGNVTKA